MEDSLLSSETGLSRSAIASGFDGCIGPATVVSSPSNANLRRSGKLWSPRATKGLISSGIYSMVSCYFMISPLHVLTSSVFTISGATSSSPLAKRMNHSRQSTTDVWRLHNFVPNIACLIVFATIRPQEYPSVCVAYSNVFPRFLNFFPNANCSHVCSRSMRSDGGLDSSLSESPIVDYKKQQYNIDCPDLPKATVSFSKSMMPTIQCQFARLIRKYNFCKPCSFA